MMSDTGWGQMGKTTVTLAGRTLPAIFAAEVPSDLRIHACDWVAVVPMENGWCVHVGRFNDDSWQASLFDGALAEHLILDGEISIRAAAVTPRCSTQEEILVHIMEWNRWGSPPKPLPARPEPRRYDYPVIWNLPLDGV